MENQTVTFTSDLVSTDPEIRALLKQKLDARVEAAKHELAQLTAERAQLEDGSTPDKVKVKASGSRKPGRPSGESPHHAQAILEVVKAAPGATLSQIFETLQKKGHPIDNKKTVATYLSKMSSDTWPASRQGLTVKGERPNTQYYAGKAPKSS